MKDDLGGLLQRVNNRMAGLLKNAQGALRGARDFTHERWQPSPPGKSKSE